MFTQNRADVVEIDKRAIHSTVMVNFFSGKIASEIAKIAKIPSRSRLSGLRAKPTTCSFKSMAVNASELVWTV